MQSLTFTHSNGIFKVTRGPDVLGQAKDLETLIENVSDQQFPDEVKWGAAEVLRSLFGRMGVGGNELIHTREP